MAFYIPTGNIFNIYIFILSYSCAYDSESKDTETVILIGRIYKKLKYNWYEEDYEVGLATVDCFFFN